MSLHSPFVRLTSPLLPLLPDLHTPLINTPTSSVSPLYLHITYSYYTLFMDFPLKTIFLEV